MSAPADRAHHPGRKVERSRYTASGVTRDDAAELGIPSYETEELSEMMSDYPGAPTQGRYAKFGSNWSRMD